MVGGRPPKDLQLWSRLGCFGHSQFNHVDTALLQEANDWVEKEWQEGPRSAWRLNCLVYSVAMAVRGKTTNESQPCNQGRKPDNQKGSKRQEGHISDRKAKGLRFIRLLAWLDVEIAHQQNNNDQMPESTPKKT